MKEKIKYTDEPMGKVKVISDFLPSPEELALKDETVKVTITLSKTSVDFFNLRVQSSWFFVLGCKK
ncbi:CopG family transcriptional regulator [Desulfonatronovibrio magnus]|uniref:CopG family transcriptional regulator n=1 Tax=Desulfonatronovibrio magnus TaxID=698827 RepID=UPI0009FCB60F|nr:CopG family transcriptional regulator [Desulfonatronovibrio magnus]